MAITTYTDEDYAAMEAALAERNKRMAEEAAKLAAQMKAREDEELAELRAWLASDHVKAVREELAAIVPSLRTVPRVAVYAYDFLGALDQAAGPLPPAPVADDAE